MRRLYIVAITLSVLASPGFADDDELGAYLFEGDCMAYTAAAIILDLGDLDREDKPKKEWIALSPDSVDQPSPVYIEDESTRKVTEKQLLSGDFSVVVTAMDSPSSKVLACTEIVPDTALPFIGELHEVDGSGMVGRVAIETHKKGVKFTTAAFAKDAVPALAD